MVIILAPSKTLDFDTPAPKWARSMQPIFYDDAHMIVKTLQKMNSAQLGKLMHVSDAIAATNHERMRQWGQITKQALWAYRGDVYKGMYADRLTHAQSEWANDHLLIMSGLYGVLRPYDVVSPYRLEMSAKLAVGIANNLYEFWDTKLTHYVDNISEGVICNLSSDEYARPVIRHSQSRIVTPVFMDHKPNGVVGQVPIYSKMMRGVMAHWMIVNQIDDAAKLQEFKEHGYVYDSARSTADAPVFVRSAPMTPLIF